MILAIKNIYIFVVSGDFADYLMCGARTTAGTVMANLVSRI